MFDGFSIYAEKTESYSKQNEKNDAITFSSITQHINIGTGPIMLSKIGSSSGPALEGIEVLYQFHLFLSKLSDEALDGQLLMFL